VLTNFLIKAIRINNSSESGSHQTASAAPLLFFPMVWRPARADSKRDRFSGVGRRLVVRYRDAHNARPLLITLCSIYVWCIARAGSATGCRNLHWGCGASCTRPDRFSCKLPFAANNDIPTRALILREGRSRDSFFLRTSMATQTNACFDTARLLFDMTISRSSRCSKQQWQYSCLEAVTLEPRSARTEPADATALNYGIATGARSWFSSS
jgi:hypothetical protein